MAHSTHFPLIFNRVNVVSVLKIGHLNLNLKTISTYLDSKYTCMNMHRGKNNCFSFFPLGLVLSSRSTSYEIVLLRRGSFSQCTYCCFQTIDSKGVFNLSTFNYTFCLHKTEIVLLISLGSTVLYWSREWQGKGKGSRRSWSSGHFLTTPMVLERLAVWFTYRMTHSPESQHIVSQTKIWIFYAKQ